MARWNGIAPTSALPLPVILIADVSGSMAGEKIEAVNSAVTEMIEIFAEEDAKGGEIHLAIVTFGRTVDLHVPLTSASDVKWTSMEAGGTTPLGAALDLVANLLEDADWLPRRARPAVLVLVSDGFPNDKWEEPLKRLLGSERGAETGRFALAIGADADYDMLRTFLNDSRRRVFEAHEASEIRRFFASVAKSVLSLPPPPTRDTAESESKRRVRSILERFERDVER